uniref:ATPase family AAA domain containing 5a n=1 Tax=Scophthalmus maximus TaxID=52904 RepID=A0A8D3AL34_SCOMX
MAGVVAMASVIEDFDTQPCKKSRKDGGSPVVKTITNYFSPVAKPLEKPFSPPRANNIMDYFARRPLSAKEKSSPSEQSKENCQTSQSAEKHTSPEAAAKQPCQKRGRKAIKVARKLVEAETVSFPGDLSCLILKPELKSIPSSPLVPLREMAKQSKTVARNSRKRPQQEAKQPELEEKEAETSVCDVNMVINEDQALPSSNSTVRISFEEFVRSQSQDEDEEEMDNDQLRNVASGEPILQVSPRTVTIQAEVHAVSPKQEAVKAGGKLASIFNKRKGGLSPAEVVSSPQTQAEHQLPSTLLTVRRKSNVVLQEEDLELAVLESESTPKCSVVERKQFMAAFKQPSQDGSKTKPGKSQGKKQPEEKNLDAEDKVAEEESTIPLSVEQIPDVSHENNVAKKKSARKNKKKAKKENEALTTSLAPPPVEEAVAMNVDDDEKIEEPVLPAVRRSRREAVVRQATETTAATPIRTNRKQNESKEADGALSDCPAQMSTPKTRKSKHGVFVAEMDKIVICFQKSNESKKRKQAKKLVEKAKVIQQSKKTAHEEKGTVRRSSRNEASNKKSYCENETAAAQTAPGKNKTQKPLRSLHEVLGKATASCTFSLTGCKVASLGPEKSARKVSAVVSIFDESSREGSENSQDDEQFRARREFLKSGLPDSFRKQIAKTAATKEAYSLSCSSFQPVIHVKQPPNDCPLWTLLWPESPLLCQLKEIWCKTSSFSSVGGSFSLKTEPARRAVCQRGSGWRPEISESVRQLLIEEVSTSNPSFPVQMFISRFLKRCTDHQQHCTASETAAPVGGKRKRMDDENAVKVAKKQRGNHLEESISMPEPEPTKRGGRTRRAQRSKLEMEVQEKAAPILCEDDAVIVLDDFVSSDLVKEDVLWTEKYQPQHSSEIIGNTASVRRLHSWLKEWKLRADREERKKQKDKKQEEGSNDSDWDCGEDDSKDAEDMLCNTMLITGPTGVGKTAAVYACAQELGFKVFEVNASSQRSGRLILSQLREATQSHQVDSQGVNAYKPTYFNSYGTSGSAGTIRPGSSPRKFNSPRRVFSSPRKHPQSPRGAKKGALAPTSLANFFKMGRPTNKEPQNTKKNEQTAASKKVTKAKNEVANKHKDLAVKSPTAATAKENSDEQSKKTATSLILFEEVDVIFDEDSGFLAAIKTFMMTTKRPVILTTSDPAFSTMFDGNFEEIHFKTPSMINVGSYLQLLCLAEGVRTDLSNISSLLRLNGCDVRQSLLQLQFWTRSAGGRRTTRSLTHTDKNGEQMKMSVCAETAPAALPPCDTGCTESRLGLLNVEPERDIWELLRVNSPYQSLEEAVCWEILIGSRRRGVDLLYSNMETLLPLPLTQFTASIAKPDKTVPEPQDDSSVGPKEQPLSTCDCSDDGSPVKVSKRMKKNKRRHRLPGQDGVHSDSDSEDGFQSLCKLQAAPQAKEVGKERLVSEKRKRKPLTPEERIKSVPVSQCLDSIAEFLDNMSYMDSSLLVHPEQGDIHRRISPVGAAVKDGMTDESRVETDRGSWSRAECVLEMQAAVEALSFRKCRGSVAEAWDKAQQLEGELGQEAKEELTLPVASHREEYSFCQDVMERLMLRGVVGTLGNRAAAALDYLPVLRTICRSEQLKEKGKVKRRFLHYLDAIHLGLEKNTLQFLAENFP